MIRDGYLTSNLLPSELSNRLDTLKLSPVILHGRGSVSTHEELSELECALFNSEIFTEALAKQDDKIVKNTSVILEVIDGVWLVTMNQVGPKNRYSDVENSFRIPIAGVLLINRSVVCGTQFMQIASKAGIDFGLLLSSFDMSKAYTDIELSRLTSTLNWIVSDALKIENNYQELQSMGSQLGETYEELSLLYKLTTSMTMDKPPIHFLEEALDELQVVVGVKWFSLKLTDEDHRLVDLCGKTINAGPVPEGINVYELLKNISDTKSIDPYGSLIIEDTVNYGVDGLSEYAHHMLFIPLICDGKCIAVLCGGDKRDKSAINSVDFKLCNALTNSLSIFLENVMLYADMQAMFMGTLHSLTSSIDAKDSYTRGHSERVAMMAKKLAEAAGLDEQTVERVYISGLVHDVGKIGVPEIVLSKPGKLTDEEYDMIKKHPEIGAKIIEDIPRMQDLIPGVLCHHERYDGRGYPYNLVGKEIPLFGRLIGLADAFDAMSSTRSYRQKLDHTHVLNEIRKCSGTQFDPELAEVFVNLDFTEYFEMIVCHRDGGFDANFSQAA